MSPKYMKLLLETQDQGGAFIGSKYKQFYQDNKRYLEMMGLGTSGSFGFRNRMTRFINEGACYIVMSNIETDSTMSNEMFAFLSDILLERLNIDFRFTKNEKKIDDYHTFKLPEESQKEYTGLYRKDNNTYFNVFDKKVTLNLHSISYKFGSYNMKEEILIPIHQKSDFSVELTLLNLYTDKYKIKKEFSFDHNTIVIIEGVFLFRKELFSYIDYKVFLDIPFEFRPLVVLVGGCGHNETAGKILNDFDDVVVVMGKVVFGHIRGYRIRDRDLPPHHVVIAGCLGKGLQGLQVDDQVGQFFFHVGGFGYSVVLGNGCGRTHQETTRRHHGNKAAPSQTPGHR